MQFYNPEDFSYFIITFYFIYIVRSSNYRL